MRPQDRIMTEVTPLEDKGGITTNRLTGKVPSHMILLLHLQDKLSGKYLLSEDRRSTTDCLLHRDFVVQYTDLNTQTKLSIFLNPEYHNKNFKMNINYFTRRHTY